MVVGVGWIDLIIADSRDLKGKRKVVRSIIDRSRHRFNVAIAEVDAQELRGRTRIGFSVVSNDRRHANSMLDQILGAIEEMAYGAIADSGFELLDFE